MDENKNQIYDPDNFISAFLMEIEENRESPNSFSEEQLLVLLLDLFLTGSEITSSMLTFVILHLVKYPDVQDKVYEELNTVVGQHNLCIIDQKR